jgi:hypothetical protein
MPRAWPAALAHAVTDVHTRGRKQKKRSRRQDRPAVRTRAGWIDQVYSALALGARPQGRLLHGVDEQLLPALNAGLVAEVAHVGTSSALCYFHLICDLLEAGSAGDVGQYLAVMARKEYCGLVQG